MKEKMHYWWWKKRNLNVIIAKLKIRPISIQKNYLNYICCNITPMSSWFDELEAINNLKNNKIIF